MKSQKIFRLACLVSCLALASNAALAETAEAESSPVGETMEPEAMTFTSVHEIQVDGKRIAYTATAGTLIMRDEEGKAIAEFGYTSYARKDSEPAMRPIFDASDKGSD